ncbi:MAG: DUF3108 domain-containing protein [Pseudomonadota bacterium]
MTNLFRKQLARMSRVLAAGLGFAVVALPAAQANQSKPVIAHNTKIQVYFAGIPVGKIKLYYNIDDQDYFLEAFVETSGISRLISDAKGRVVNKGSIAGATVAVKSNSAVFSEGKRNMSVDIGFANKRVKKVVATPPIKYAEGHIPVRAIHRKDVVDPASSAFIPVSARHIGNGPAICNRTLKLFDGQYRMDIRMQYKGARNLKVRGFKGKTYVCAVRYEPVAGHRDFKKNIQFMKNNKDIEIALARVGTSNVYGIIGFAIRTQAGWVTGKPYKFVTELRQ